VVGDLDALHLREGRFLGQPFDGVHRGSGAAMTVDEKRAVLITWPASRSACVTVCDPLHVVDVPGARLLAGQDTPATPGSDTANASIVTLPMFVTVNEHATTSPTAVIASTVVDLTSERAGCRVAETTTSFDPTGGTGPSGATPTAVAVFTT
jgi:hypothetical protein